MMPTTNLAFTRIKIEKVHHYYHQQRQQQQEDQQEKYVYCTPQKDANIGDTIQVVLVS